jgi:16S rRNA (guanine527-N7)-methyltransferase
VSAAPTLRGADRDRVLGVLASSRRLGFLGPGPIEVHVEHSAAFTAAWAAVRPTADPSRILDLGSGGGVPGLVLALLWPEAAVTLLDGMVRRTSFLEEAVEELGLTGRVHVVTARAEDAGRGPLRGSFDLVTARSFAAAPVTAECAAPLTRDDGLVAVAEPPTPAAGRWPAGPLAELGLHPAAQIDEPFHVQVLERTGPVPDRYPRRVGVPAKRPLWDEGKH